MKAILSTVIILASTAAGHAGEALSAAAYDRNKDGVLDAAEALVWRLHVQDPILAKYDTNFNGRLDPSEAEKISADSSASLSGRSHSVVDDVSFFRNRKVADIDRVATSRPPPALPKSAELPKAGCDSQQRLYVRRDRLDTYQYRQDTAFATGVVPRSKAKGASASFSHDDLDRSDALTLNGRVSYVLVQNDPMSPCFGLGTDPYAKQDFNTPSLFGSTVALWTDAQGTINSPRARSERSALKTGVDAQASIAGGPLFDLQYVIAAPYAQTDFRGAARIYGFTGAWEPIAAASNIRLGGALSAPASRYLDWYWQFRAEADLKRVDVAGLTALTRGDYVWGGASARLHLTPFPDLSVFDPFGPVVFPDLVGRLYADLTVNYHREFQRGIDALLWSAEVGVNVTPDGSASVSVNYTDGRDKDTLVKQRQTTVTLNYKF